LNALRAFEAAGRLESFNRAAEELHVTPSAVSHQIRSLEDFLGAKLFVRATRQVRLSEDGRELLSSVQNAFALITSAARRVQRNHDDGTLTLQTSPNFATEWLVPRLIGFQHEHPEIEVRLVTIIGHDESRMDIENIDLAVWYGNGRWPGVTSERLMSEHLVPVCSPSLVTETGGLREPADLRHATLIHVLVRIGQWRNWLMAAGLDGVDPNAGPKFQNTPLALEAAAAGMGVAIANRAFVEGLLKDRRLVIPFEVELASQSAYYMLYAEEALKRPSVAAFRAWIKDIIEHEGVDEPAVHHHIPGRRVRSDTTTD
jgi:LysR family glycine cleavage system transcriptional activator